jgi:Outer membrane protein beta-barrel domain
MQQSEFEKQVQQKMEELKLSPADAVWGKVEAGLPVEKRPRRRVFFILLLAGLLTGSLLLWNNFNGGDKKLVENDRAVKESILKNKVEKEKPPATEIITAQNNNDGIKIKSGNSCGDKTKVVAKLKSKPKSEVAVKNTAAINSIIAKVKTVNTKAALKIKTKIPVAVDDEQELIVAPEKKNLTENAKTLVRVGAPVPVNDNAMEEAIKSTVDSSAVTDKDAAKNKDTAITTATDKSEKKKNNLKWQYGIKVAAGSGALKKDLFSSTALFAADARLFNNSAGIPPPTVQIISKPNNPVTGPAFNIGFYAQKNINARWKFSTGLNYAYQSNIIKVGKRVDSVATFNFDATKSLSADNYYKIGDGIKYKSKFHLLEMPFLFQWKLSKKSPVYLEGGPTLLYLVNSNALVYNSISSAYFTDGAVFNKLLLSFTAGAGINLAQNKQLPFSVGYQFGYSTSSATKKVFGKQHFVSSMLYVKIPFKK